MDDEKNKDNNTSEEKTSMGETLDNTASLEEDSSQSVKNENEEDIKAEETHSTDNSSSSMDLNKVKIRQVLMHRIKNCKPNIKKIIAFILIAIVFFGAGLFTGRGITRHKLGKNFNGKPAIQRKMQKGFGRNKNFKINDGNKTQTPAQGQTQN